MCLLLYAGTTAPLPLVPWSDAAPAFYVTEVQPTEPARAWLAAPYVYELGSHEGCGCGYSSGSPEERGAREASREALVRYLEAALATGPVRLFAGWNGYAPRLPLEGEIGLATLASAEFWDGVHQGAAVRDQAYVWAIRSGPADPGNDSDQTASGDGRVTTPTPESMR